MSKFLFYSHSVGNHQLLFFSFILLTIALFFSSFTIYSNYLLYPVWVLWVPYLVADVRLLSLNERKFFELSIAFLALIWIYRLIGYSSMSTSKLMNDINWIMSGVVAVYSMKLFSKRELSNVYSLLTIALILLLLLFIRDGRYLMELGEQEDASGAANTWYGSLFMLITGLSLITFMHVKTWTIRVVSLSIMLLTIYLNFYIMQRGINVIFSLAEIGLILVFVLKRKSLIYVLSIAIISVAIYVFSSGMLIDMFDWLADITPSDRLARRFSEISTALYYEDIDASSGSLSGRNRLIGISWNTFTSNIGYLFFGAGEHTQNNLIIGHHSFFIDTLACYGIVGGGLTIAYFVKQYQIIMSVFNKNAEWALYMQCTIVFLFYALRNIYGGITTGLANLVIMLYFPMTFQIIRYYKK